MKLSAILAPMIAAGVPGDVILATVRAFEEQADAAAEQSKEKARARWHRWNDKQSTNVGKRLQTDTNASKQLMRVEDSSSKKDITGKIESKEDTSPPARSKRGERIPDDFQPDIEAAVADGLQRHDAEMQARNFCDYWRAKPGKDGLKLDWPATWRVWYRRNLTAPQRATSPPSRKPNAFDAYDEIAQMKGWNDEPASLSGANQDAERLPAVGGGPSGPLVDLRRGHDWHPGSGDN